MGIKCSSQADFLRAAAAAAGMEEALTRAAKAIEKADALLITTGAGMGVDSGLGTFRGRNAGVWPPLKALRRDFSEMSTPRWFNTDPRLAWAFWHFRHEAYTKGSPHAGYDILSKWANSKTHGYFSVTSNIDGHWERTKGIKASRVYECHGALTHMQCVEDDGRIWKTDPEQIGSLQVPDWDVTPGEEVEAKVSAKWVPAKVGEDGASIFSMQGDPLQAEGVRRKGGQDLMRVVEGCPLPAAPESSAAARPNVLMFGDWGVNVSRIQNQGEAFDSWVRGLLGTANLAIIEIGAGLTVSTIRHISETTLRQVSNSTLIRINLDDSSVKGAREDRSISIGGLGALDALSRIDAIIQRDVGK
mmetsp:Transcript_62354/g.115732  ORF Transcript_62354/g.115732 Transcript_62354/m.115732 type:complete len:359 (+) Transcript_62354:1-1077(+)